MEGKEKPHCRTLDYLDTIQDDFQYYRNHRSNSWASEGALHIMPTLTAMEFGEDFLYNGCIDLNNEVGEVVRHSDSACQFLY